MRDSEDDFKHQYRESVDGIDEDEVEEEAMQDIPLLDSLIHSPDLITWSLDNLEIVGIRHRMAEERAASSGASSSDSMELPIPTHQEPLALEREPDNAFDMHAIKVVASSPPHRHLGYLPRTISLKLAPLIDAREAEASCTLHSLTSNHDAKVKALIKLTIKEVKYGSLGFESSPPSSFGLSSRRQRLVSTLKSIASAAEQRSERTGQILVSSFYEMVSTVMQHDMHLLSSDEIKALKEMQRLKESSICLFLRLFLRKSIWFRVSQLQGQYEEVEDMDDCLSSLLSTGFIVEPSIDSDRECSWRNCAAHLLPIAELRSLASKWDLEVDGSFSSVTRASIILALTASRQDKVPEDEEGLAIATKMLGRCIKLNPLTVIVVKRVQQIFFLDPELDLSRFVAAQKNVTPYPFYEVVRSPGCHVFKSRSDLLSYEEARTTQTMVEALLSVDKIDEEAAEAAFEKAWSYLAAMRSAASAEGSRMSCGDGTKQDDEPLSFFARFSAPWAYTRVLWWAVGYYEKRKRYQKAIEALKLLLSGPWSASKRGDWHTRLSIDLEHLGDIDAALAASEAALLDPFVRFGDKLGLQRRVIRLGKPPRRWKKPAWASELLWEPREKVIFSSPLAEERGIKSQFKSLLDPSRLVSVEQLALEHYSSQEGGSWKGVHSEGGVWSTLFGLLFWDLIFSSTIPEVFRSRFQSAPLDFGSDTFYETRRSGIDVRLGEIASGQAPSLLAATWSSNQGRWCKGINWNHFKLADLVDICECVGPIGLSVVMRMLAEDYRGVRGGMPDLLLWSMDRSTDEPGTSCHSEAVKKGQPRAMLSEVKGHNDRLSESQRAWIRALGLADIQVEVLRVSFDKKAKVGGASSSRRVEPKKEAAADNKAQREATKQEPSAGASSCDQQAPPSSGVQRIGTAVKSGKKRQSSIDGFFSTKGRNTGKKAAKKECIEIDNEEVIVLESD